MNAIEGFSKEYPRVILLLTIPFYAVFSFLWFRKSKLNFSEHLVLNSYKTVVELIITLVFTITTTFYTNKNGLILVYILISLCPLIYSFWYYRQFFSDYGYSKRSLIIRSLGATFSYYIISFVFGVVMAIIKIIG